MLLQIYREGKLHDRWKEKTQVLIKENQDLSPLRCGEIVAAMLAYRLGQEVAVLERKVHPFSMTEEEASLYDWLYVEDNARYRADLQDWSGTRTMLLDTPYDGHTPEWMFSIKISADF